MAYSGGDNVHAVVADVGSYATKMGFAGEDYPRSYFRSNVAILRQQQQQQNHDDKNTNKNTSNPQQQDREESTTTTSSGNGGMKHQRTNRIPIADLKYDYLTRPLNPKDGTDGSWEAFNPVDSTTGLWYDHNVYNNNNKQSSTSSHNSNNDKDTTPTGSGADWYDALSHMIRHGYDSALGSQPSNHPLLLAERTYNPPPLRQQLVELLFEDLQVPATFVARDATLACYATGRTTGTVIDIGYNGTVVTPVYDGYVEQKGIRRSPVGGKVMDERVLQTLDGLYAHTITSSSSSNKQQQQFMPLYQLRQKSNNYTQRSSIFHHLARLDVARQCKEEGAGAAVLLSSSSSGGGGDGTTTAASTNTTNDMASAFNVPHISYELPDGQKVDVPGTQRFAVANLLFGLNDESTKKREELTAHHQKQCTDYTSRTLQLLDEMEEEDDDTTRETNEDGTKDFGVGSTTKKDKFSENAAVGLSTRRSKSVQQQKKQQKQQKQQQQQHQRSPCSFFANHHLQRACLPYIQNSIMEQLSSNPIPSLVCDAAFRCDRDQQASLLGNVILCGGGACLGPTDQAVPDIVREQVESIIHTHTPGWRVKVLSPSIQERAICNWLGGSILGSLGTFHDMWITKAEYEEWGSAIVNRKCP